MDMSCRLAVAFVLLFALRPIPALGQGLTARSAGRSKTNRAERSLPPRSPWHHPRRSAEPSARQRMTGDSGDFRSWPGRLRPGRREATRFAAHREEGVRIGAGASIDRPVVLGGRRCPVNKRRGRLERRVALQRARDPVRPRLPGDHPIAAVQHVRRDPERSRHVAHVAVQRHRQHSVLVRLRRNENPFLIDGTNFTCPCPGVSGPNRALTSSRRCTCNRLERRSSSATSRARSSTS